MYKIKTFERDSVAYFLDKKDKNGKFVLDLGDYFNSLILIVWFLFDFSTENSTVE